MRRNLVIAIGLGLTIATSQPGLAMPVAQSVEAAAYGEAVDSLAGKLEASYVDPAVGKLYAAMLRANRATYLRIDDPAVLAKRLTTDLQAVHADGHLRVSIPGVGGAPGPRAARPSDGPAIQDPKWIADGVAYVRFTMFDGSPESLATLEAFMKEHADAKAIIFDARGHHGGGPDEMDVILPYLFAQPTRLVTLDLAQSVVDALEEPPRDPAYMRHVVGPPGVYRREHWVTPNAETRLRGAKVFYLTSRATASAGEHLALALQRTHRGLVVGERTAGANHFGGFEPIGAGLTAFVPVGRAFDPDTGKDWEGVGLTPDVVVPADQALDKALELARAGV
ncbi:S41 family peptidase [Caulobacter sp.]|uniref:S41 family peptidase n=1 Tax=Caulobacter sp. TaxID=78 RepID=UPI002B49F56E|nr:S41 family peptidase [Caulobacter sp.]HJV43732.1 S41 family peptidase [Caulobacter sp.]